MSVNYNQFGSTKIYGLLQNSNDTKHNVTVNAIIDNNLTVSGNLYLGKETSSTTNNITTYTDTGGNIYFNINGI